MRLYRFLTGPDDAAFCARVEAALNAGWQLHGSPSLTIVDGKGYCGQAIVREVPGEYAGFRTQAEINAEFPA